METIGMSGAGSNNGGEAGAEGVRGVVGFIENEDWFTGLIKSFSNVIMKLLES